MGHQSGLAKFVRDMLLNEARWVHGWDLASMYVLHLLCHSVPVFQREGRTEVRGGREGMRDKDVT